VVAETELVGFSDRGEVLRAPIVTVYSKAAP
jgi:molecular chaperone GrpE